MNEGSKQTRNNTKKTAQQETGGKRKGTKTTAETNKRPDSKHQASVPRVKFAEEENRKKSRRNHQDAKKPDAAEKTEEKRRQKKTALADKDGQSIHCVTKGPENEATKRRTCTSNEDKSKIPRGTGKEVNMQRKMKMAEQMEVRAFETDVRNKKAKAEEKEKIKEQTRSTDNRSGRREDDVSEQNIQKSEEFQSVECNEKETKPKKKLQLLEEILRLDRESRSQDNNRNPKPGRKERNADSAISEQIIEVKVNRPDAKLQKTPTKKGHVTIPKTQGECMKQINSASAINTKNVRPVVGPNIQEASGQSLYGPVNFPARAVDSPYISDIRHRGQKVLNTHRQPCSNKKPMPVVPSKESKIHCNLPKIYGSAKQSHVITASDQVSACSAMRRNAYNEPGSPPAKCIHVPHIPPKATIGHAAIRKICTSHAGEIPSQLRKPSQSAEEIQIKCLQPPNTHVETKISVDRTMEEFVALQNKNEKTVSISCYNQKKGENGRLTRRNRNTNVSTQNISAYNRMVSNGPQATRKLSLSRRQGT